MKENITAEDCAVGLQPVREHFAGDERIVAEFTLTFREDAEKALHLLKEHCTVGDSTGAIADGEKLKELSSRIAANSIAEQAETVLAELRASNLTHVLTGLIPKLETALQGTVETLRKENMLNGGVTLPAAPPRPTEIQDPPAPIP